MSVIFNEEQNTQSNTSHRQRLVKGMPGLLLRLGICKTERGANVVLILFSLIVVCITVLLLNVNAHPTPPPGFQKVRLR